MVVASVIVFGTVAAVLAVYFAARTILNPDPDDRAVDLAGKVLIRVATLHGLVLALVFASEVVEYHQLSFESAIETNAASDAFYDADRYGADETEAIRVALRTYLQIAATSEWASLGAGNGLQQEAWLAWNDAYNATLDLVPTNPRQEALRDNILSKIHLISQNRDLREHHAKISLNALFWVAAVAGIFLIAVGFYPYPPKRENIVLLVVYAAYTGLILFTIYAMSNPYTAPAALEPVLFEQLLEEIEA
jgi:hypothetical protein